MVLAVTFWTAASSAPALAISPEAPAMPPEVEKSAAAGRVAKLFVYPAGPTEAASIRAPTHAHAARTLTRYPFAALLLRRPGCDLPRIAWLVMDDPPRRRSNWRARTCIFII